jgi:hypothetical protein
MDLTILYELANISKEVHPAVYTLLGVILGATIPLLKDRYDKKPRLSGSIVPYQSEFYVPRERMTKTSPSGYALELYNYGMEPLILTWLSVKGECGTLMADCLLQGECTVIKPYDKYVCPLMWQDYSSILFHCQNKNGAAMKARVLKLFHRDRSELSKDMDDIVIEKPYLLSRTIDGQEVRASLAISPIWGEIFGMNAAKKAMMELELQKRENTEN